MMKRRIAHSAVSWGQVERMVRSNDVQVGFQEGGDYAFALRFFVAGQVCLVILVEYLEQRKD